MNVACCLVKISARRRAASPSRLLPTVMCHCGSCILAPFLHFIIIIIIIIIIHFIIYTNVPLEFATNVIKTIN